MSEHVYFVGNENQVKIGKSNNIASRISNIRTSSPVDIKLLTSVSCISMTDTENMLHKVFDKIRYKGEWFFNIGDLAELIARLQTYSAPSEFVLGYEMASIAQRGKDRDVTRYQHRLRAITHALIKLGFDINSDAFHEAQNKFLEGLVEEHPFVYKQFFAMSDNKIGVTLDVPYQPYPVYENLIVSIPDVLITESAEGRKNG